ncbi:MAG: hypothetical protein ACYC6Y_02975 [Thermoguttaceae bacterium]
MSTSRHAGAWSRTMLSLAMGLVGALALVRMATSVYDRCQLQGDADRTALALAGTFARRMDASLAEYPQVPGPVRFGRWDGTRRRFRPASVGVNAIEVAMERQVEPTSGDWWSPWFVPVGAAKTRAVAALRPRDIVLVIDLSNAMTGETRAALEQLLAPATQCSEPAGDQELRRLYADLGLETYPGPVEPFGAPWHAGECMVAYQTLVSESGPLADPTTDERYRIVAGEPVSARRRKAYLAVIDQQILRLMPKALPTPDRPENFDYWAGYLDDLVASPPGDSRIGYASYIRYMLRQGRSIRVGGRHVPLSQFAEDCPWRRELVDGRPRLFPPRFEPMYTVQRGLLAALRDLAERNDALEPAANRDRVAVLTFDSLSPGGAWLEQPLTSDYEAVAAKVARLQPVGQRARPTAGLAALQRAEALLRQSGQETSWVRDPYPLVLFVTVQAVDCQGDVAAQIARMARLDQTVKVIDAGKIAGATTDPAGARARRLVYGQTGAASSRPEPVDSGLNESSFTDAIAFSPVALVE